MFGQMDEAWGGIDILVNNAGIDGGRAMGWEADLTAWRKVIEVNLFGAFHCAREALRRMVPQKSGVVLNISSVHEIIAWSGYSAYTASKAAVGMLTKTLAQEAAPHGVRVLAMPPSAWQVGGPVNSGTRGAVCLESHTRCMFPAVRIGRGRCAASSRAICPAGAISAYSWPPRSSSDAPKDAVW